MAVNPIEEIGGLTTTADVPKPDIVAWGKNHVAQVVDSADTVQSTNLAGQQAIQVKSLKQAYYIDTADTTTPHSPPSCLVSADGFRFKPVKLFPDGDIVGTTDVQTLTNKTIDADDNQILNLVGANFAPTPAASLFGNMTGAPAAPDSFTLQGLTELASPHGVLDFLLGYDHVAGAFAKVKPGRIAPQAVLDSVAALRALDSTSLSRALLLGYYEVGDCRWRAYWKDSADATSADNGGTIIVGADNARWKLVGNQLTVKTFGAKDDGSDASALTTVAVNYAAAQNLPLEWDGIFSTPGLEFTDLQGQHWIGRGGVKGIATSSTTAVLSLVNCGDLTINGRFIIDGSFNTNYACGLHIRTNAPSPGKTSQYIDLTNVIYNGCRVGLVVGDTTQPDATISEINIRGGRTFGCPGIARLIGTQTVVNFSNATLQSSYNTADATWRTLPMVGIESVGATVHVTGCEVLNTAETANSLFQLTAISAAGGVKQYGNISVSNCVIENANALLYTSDAGLASPTWGRFSLKGSRFVHSQNTQAYIQTDNSFAGRVEVLENWGTAGVSRTNLNIAIGNSNCEVYFDLQSFGSGFLQGYAGVSGGKQYLVSKDIAPGVIVTGSAATQGKADSIVTFATSAACTYTLLDPSRYPGRLLYLNNTAAFAINSASANVLTTSGAPSASILPATAGSWVILISDTSQGNFWRVVASSGAGVGSTVASMNIVKFTAGGTYTPPANLLFAEMEGVGGGGGGGGVTGVASTYMSAGGGAGGGYAKAKVTKAQIGASATVTIGAGGGAGATSGNGGAGGTTSVVSASAVTLLSASGGAGGNASTGTAAVGGGSLAGAGTTGDLLLPGDDGGGGSSFPTANGQAIYTNHGGGSKFSGSAMVSTGAAVGQAGKNYGGGASGSTSADTTSRAGAAGAPGIVVITEYLA